MIVMNSKILFICTLLFLNSCGSFEEEKKRLMTTPEKKDLVNSFDIEKTQAEKYKEKDAAELKKEDVVKEKQLPKKVVKEKKQKTSKIGHGSNRPK